jgi:DNA-binding transcriptional regulator YiaG
MNYTETKKMWELQRKEWKRLRHKEKLTLRAIAEMYGVTIQRVLKVVGPRKTDD